MRLLERSLDWTGAMPVSGLAAAAETVMAGDIVVLKRAFPEDRMDRCKRALLDWQARHPESNPERLRANAHWWRRDVNPPSKTKHLFETFCLVFDKATDPLAEVAAVFESMAGIWHALTGRGETMRPDAEGRMLRPQVIHYPRGGGFFDWHRHDLQPQGIGLIVGLSKCGRDFATGGTRFRDGGTEIDTAEAHDIGDICLFRYDLDHSVGEVDGGRPLEWGGTGRWTMVLPLM